MRLLRLGVLFSVLMLAASTSVFAVDAEKPSLKIGAVFSLKGKYKALGRPERDTVQMIAEQVNNSGGINGFPVEVIIRDDESLKVGAEVQVLDLIHEHNVLAIIGPTTSGNSIAVKRIAEKARVPLVSCAAAEAIISPPTESRFVFKTPQRDSHVAIRIIEEIQKRGIDKIAVLSDSTGFGQQGRRKLQRAAYNMGVELVADEVYAVNAKDMTKLVAKGKANGAGAYVNWSVIPTQTIVAKNMKQLGIDAPLFFSHGFGNPRLISICGKACDGIVFPAGRLLVADQLPDRLYHKQVLLDFKHAYEKKYGVGVSTFGGHAYDAFWIVLNAIKRQKIMPTMDVATARDFIREGIEETKEWTGTAGVFNITASDHCGLDKDKSLEMLIVRNGRMELLNKAK